MSQLVSEILSIGGQSLEQEEQFLRWFSERKGEVGGLLRVDLICFPQYVFGRAIVPTYSSTLKFTLEGRRVGELKVKYHRNEYFFIMDYWADESLAPLQDDADRLATQKAEAYLLVFSANPYGETEGRLRLIDGLSGVEPRTSLYRLGAQTEKGETYEFWVGAWRVPPRRSAGPSPES